MPELGVFHPQIVHFVVALGIIGVLFRLVSLTGRLTWTGPAATALLLMAAVASVVAAQSGHEAHEVPESIPGIRPAVHEHEEAGEWARNIFVLIGLLEIGGLLFRNREKVAKGVMIGSALAGLAGVGALYKAGDRGGELVYSYAGGVGTRSGDPADVRHLLIAGLYNQAKIARDSGQLEESARLTDELARQAPDDPNVKLLGAASLLKDRKDPQAALAALAAIPIPQDNRFFEVQKTMLTGEVLIAAGQKDSARALLTALVAKYPMIPWLKGEIAKIQ
jgi:uncharacterized membrane protein